MCNVFPPEGRDKHLHISANILNEEDINADSQSAHSRREKLDNDRDANADERLSQNVIPNQWDVAVWGIQKHDAS